MQVRLLDFGRFVSLGSTVGRCRSLAWPVRTYRVTLPQPKDNPTSLNPFEILVLKFLTVDPNISNSCLEDETCLPGDLLQGIICRLKDRGFLDENRRVNESWENPSVLGSFSELLSDGGSGDGYETAVIFQDVYSNKLLPFLHYTKNSPLRKNNDENFLKRHKWLPFDFTAETPIPTPQDIIVALREMKSLELHRGQREKLPRLQQIRVFPDFEPYYLSCPIGIQRDGDFRIGDPFGRGYSSLLEREFSRIMEQESVYAWFKEWQESLYTEPQAEEEDVKYSFDTPELRREFPMLVKSLVPKKGKAFRSVSKIYASLEWALYYFCLQFSYEKTLGRLMITPRVDIPKRLAEISESLGFDKYVPGFCWVKPGKIYDFRSGKAEMPMVIALSLMLSKESSPSCFTETPEKALCKIAQHYPDFFDRVYALKNERDRFEHGGAKEHSDVELASDRFMTDVVTILLPKIQFKDAGIAQAQFTEERFFNLNSEGRIGIQEYYGIKTFNDMGELLQQRLISAESFWVSLKNEQRSDDAIQFVCDLYASIQVAFRRHLQRGGGAEIPDDLILRVAQQKARDAGFSEIPSLVKGTRIAMIRQTISGREQTLGAVMLAFLLVVEPEVLAVVHKKQPSFLEDINKIIAARGHGNQISSVEVADIKNLRKIAYTTIKSLLEV